MKKLQHGFTNIDDYIQCFDSDIQEKLIQMREVIKKAVPEAEEVISYQMPAFKYEGILVYFAAAKSHIGFYPTSSGILAFSSELAEYKTSKGAVQFPYNKPIPFDLIEKIAVFRFIENRKKQN